MKKILCGILCASAGAALAVEVTVATVDVIQVNSSLSNTVVAIPGLDLATGGDLAISNLVLTTNLTNGDKLYAFDNGNYEVWTLSGGVWEKNDKLFTVDALGHPAEKSGTPSDQMTMSVGSGIWLSRQNFASPFYVYAAHVAAPTTTVTKATTALVGNPTLLARQPTIATPQEGDQVILPTSGMPVAYTYNGSSWTVPGGWSGTKTTPLPSIEAGTGFWYVSNSNSVSGVTITWP